LETRANILKETHRNLRKAAVLVASLDAERAEAMLAQMAPAQREALRAAVEALGELDPVEQSEVIEEFFRIGPLLPDREPSGIELDDPKFAELAEPAGEDSLAARRQTAAAFLCDASADALATFLAGEHPQTVAVVLSHLPADRSAQVLAGLSSERQVEVARRLANLDETDAEVLREIERGVQSWLAEVERSERKRAAGAAALNSILQAANPRTRDHILTNLAKEQHPLAEGVEADNRPRLEFADLERLSSTLLTAVLHHAEGELLALALAGARPEFAERCFRLLSPDRACETRRAVSHLGPTRLSDIEESQQALAELAVQLDVTSRNALSERRRLSVAA
jgi:flagellar motor switch protein FliG